MHWLLTGCCGLVLIGLSVTQDVNLEVTQNPRYYGIKTGQSASISCSIKSDLQVDVEWYRTEKYDQPAKKREPLGRENISYRNTTMRQTSIFWLRNAQMKDNAVYFCKVNEKWGRGTQVHVVRNIEITKALHYSRVKDGLMVFQGVLLAVCIGALLIRKHIQSDNSDSLYEEPETDHIYEGLAIETCSGGLYEDLAIYAQAEGSEAPWERD